MTYFPTFKSFKTFCGKQKIKTTILVVILYPFALIGLALFYCFLISLALMIKGQNKTSYRTSPNYRKVIKEGLFWDTVEYHEK